jgi:hypothetical protein
MKKIYVGCSIAWATKEYLSEIAELKNLIKSELKCELMEFIPIGTGTAEEVYLNDIHHAVFNCDVMVAEVSYPSLGLGWEMATAVEKFRKPVLFCAKEGANVSRLIQGAVGSKNPDCAFVRYEKITDLIPHIKKLLENEQEKK